jgi:extracellular factor (EF) 3-hydroxypalmitic acid methyl ester biosynthesis protein
MNQANAVQLQTDYVSIVDEIVQYLESVKLCCEGLLELEDGNNKKLKSSFIAKMEQLFDRFELIASVVPSADIETHKTYFRRYVHPLIMSSKIVERIYKKPLGYPGDYEMINMLMGEVDVPTKGLFQQLIDESHKTARAARAHKNRISMMSQRLIDEAVRVGKLERMFSVLCIGCGPAIELQQFILNSELSNNCFIHVVDFNQDSIDNIQQTLAELNRLYLRNNIVEADYMNLADLIDSNAPNYIGNIQSYDMVYCAGLFDYISDELCREVINFGYSCLRSSGSLTVTNVHPNIPNKQYLEYALEWKFIYRDEKKLSLLSPSNKYSQVTTDETGLNVFLDIRKLN